MGREPPLPQRGINAAAPDAGPSATAIQPEEVITERLAIAV